MINVLIVAHKPWVASLYKSHIDNMDRFKVAGIAENINAIKGFYENDSVNLIILDVMDNLHFMKKLRNLKITADIIPLTSFRKMKNMNLYLKLGMVDYIIKPFEYDDFKRILENYTKNSGDVKNNVSSGLLKDSLALELSLSKRTLDRINEFLKMNRRFLTSSEIGEQLKLSINTIRKYLRYLYSIGEITKKTTQRSSGKATCYYKHTAGEIF